LKINLLLATSNLGKIKELDQILSQAKLSQKYHLLSLEDCPGALLNVAETGQTFSDNARIKALAFGNRTGLLTLADDSGLEVTALNGFPGVQSARWLAGSDADRNQALLKKMADVSDRSAQFTCNLCLYSPRLKKDWLFEGQVKGQIAHQPQGDQGFGYDPIFIPQGFDLTFGKLGGKIKNRVSHRAQALKKFVQFLATNKLG